VHSLNNKKEEYFFPRFFVIHSSPTSQKELLWRVLKMHRCILLYFPACRAKSCCRADDAFCYIFQPAKLKDVVELMMHFVIFSSLLSQKLL
jgi:hypothetical protein